MADDREIAALIAALSPEEQSELESALQTQPAHTNPPMAGPGPNELAETAPRASAASRFFAPIGQAIKGAASLPGAIVEGARNTFTGENGGYGGSVDRAGRPAVEAQVAQFDKANEAGARGDVSEALGHVAAGALPVVGPAAADIGETLGSGDVAGALGQSAVLAAPMVEPGAYASRMSGLLKNQAAKRILAVMRPVEKRMATAEQIAPEVVNGVVGREASGGIGVGTRQELARRMEARSKLAGETLEGLQQLDTPVDPSPVSSALRARAAAKETRAPNGAVFTEDPALVEALRGHADKIDEMAASFGGKVPGGEIFKQRAVLGKKLGGKGANVIPGDLTTAQVEAGTARNAETSALLHDETKFGKGGLGGSAIVDNEYHVTRNAYINLNKSRLRDMLGRDGKQILNLLAGRLAGGVAGGLSGYAAGGGHMAGLAGAALGVTLGESAYWGSLRAATYNEIANLLKVGNMDGAVDVIQRSALTYAADKAVKERERNKKAQAALASQAHGVVSP